MNRQLSSARRVFGLRSFLQAIRSPQSSKVALVAAGLALAIAVAPMAASAATIINYGSFMGNTVLYNNVKEASNSGDAVPLFGPPEVLVVPNPVTYPANPCIMCAIGGDTLDFTPTGFSASSAGATFPDITDGNLSFGLLAKPGSTIANIQISEQGDTSLFGTGNAGSNTMAFVSGTANIQAVNGSGISSIAVQFMQQIAAFSLNTHAPGTYPWGGTVFVDLTTNNPVVAAGYAARGLNPALQATQVTVNFDNVLIASSQALSSVLIAKKDALIIKTNIPEPTSVALSMLGLVAGAMFVRRSR